MSRQAELTRIDVVAGILIDAASRVLIAERLGDGPFHGMWEFPGGKIRQQEAAEDALARELVEEIGVEPLRAEPFMRISHAYEDRHVSIEFYLVREWRNAPSGLEGQALRWVRASELHAEPLLPADLPVVRALATLAS